MGKKNLQPRLEKTIFQVRYKPEIHYLSKILPASQAFADYPNWKVEDPEISLHNYLNHCSLKIFYSTFAYVQERNNFEKDRVKEAIEKLPSLLDIPCYTQLGFRQIYLLPIKMTPFDFLESYFL